MTNPLIVFVKTRRNPYPLVFTCLRESGIQLPVAYMSGYPADFVESRVQLGESDILVHKPFTAATLISALRQQAARRSA